VKVKPTTALRGNIARLWAPQNALLRKVFLHAIALASRDNKRPNRRMKTEPRTGRRPAPDTNHLSRRIILVSVANGIAAVLVVIGVLFWMAGRVNSMAAQSSETLLNSAVSAELRRVEVSTADYAFWDYAHELVSARNSQDLYVDFGSGATEGVTFDFIYILDTDGSPLYAYQTGNRASDLSGFDPNLRAAFYPNVINQPLSEFSVVSSYAYDGDQLAVVAAASIRPDATGNRSATDFPVMIAGRWLTQDLLTDIAKQLLISDVALKNDGMTVSPRQSSLALAGPDGQSIGQIIWTAPRPSTQLLATALPVVFILSVLTLAATLFVGRTTAQQTQAILRQQQIARTDQLTGLMNRAGLEELLTTMPVQVAIATGKIAVLYLDLNDFKQINDNEGHDAGDLALQIFAERVRGALRAKDVVVRLGGDEFICILLDEAPGQTADHIARRIATATAPPVRIGDVAHPLSPAIGVAIGAPGIEWPELLKNADTAMYHAKMSTTQEAVFFADKMQAHLPRVTASAN
jgi:diguanylate cyclase (GGDEF)-like protein